jgi:hypothetical protein
MKVHLMFFIHNVIAHPVGEALFWLSLMGRIKPINRLGRWFHNVTVPNGMEDRG